MATETEIQDFLCELLRTACYTESDDEGELADILTEHSLLGECGTCETFKNSALLTRDAGVVFKLRDGSEFQVTVKRSR